jgi:hypothetical protein
VPGISATQVYAGKGPGAAENRFGNTRATLRIIPLIRSVHFGRKLPFLQSTDASNPPFSRGKPPFLTWHALCKSTPVNPLKQNLKEKEINHVGKKD